MLGAALCLVSAGALAEVSTTEDAVATEAARETKVVCEKIREVIIPLKPPVFGGSVLWRRVEGVMGEDRFVDIVQDQNDPVLYMIGETRPFIPDTKEIGDAIFFVLATDPMGKPLWDKRITDDALSHVESAVLLNDHVVVLNAARDKDGQDTTRITFFDKKAQRVRDKMLSDADYYLYPRDIAVEDASNNLIVAVWAVHKKNADDNHTILFQLTEKGDVVWRKEYLPGVKNKLDMIYKARNGQIVGAGRIENDAGKEQGWMLVASAEGDILLQKPFSRGSQSLLRKGVETLDGGYLLIGDSLPATGGMRAAWIMKLRAGGDVEWQRFVTGKYSYAAMDSIIYPDGRINILLSGRPADKGGREHARVLTFTPDGFLLNDEAFIEKSNSIATRILPIDTSRVIIGMAQTGFVEDNVSADMKLTTYDAWASGLMPLPSYMNPCIGPVQESLELE